MAEESVVAYHIIVTGRVQGVGFRYSTRQTAVRLAVHGWVRNRSDGSVEVVCEGEKSRVQRLIKWLQSGPPGSYVTGFEKRAIKPQKTYRSFSVEF